MTTLEHAPAALTRSKLLALARELRARRDLWEPLVRHTPEERHSALLRHDDQVTAYVIAWLDGHDTGFHDHDLSAGAVAVARGKIREERPRLGAPPSSRVLVAGDTLDFAPSEIHRVRHEPSGPAVTIHVYSPPLRRMSSYPVDEDGSFRRESVIYAEDGLTPA